MPRSFINWSLGMLICSVVLFPAAPVIYLQFKMIQHKALVYKSEINSPLVKNFTFSNADFHDYVIDKNELLIQNKRYDILEKVWFSNDSVKVKLLRDSYEEELLLQIIALNTTHESHLPLFLRLVNPDWTFVPLFLKQNQDISFVQSIPDYNPEHYLIQFYFVWFPPPDSFRI